MKKIVSLFIVLVLIISFTGCTQTTQEKKSENKEQGKEVSAETIQNILNKVKNIESVEYELAMALNDSPIPATLKAYQKGLKYRLETEFMGQESIAVYDGKFMYTYVPEEDIYYKAETETTSAMDFQEIAKQALNDISMKELGREEINGLNAIIIEFNYKEGAEEAIKTKAWISEEYGIALKLESETEAGKVSIELKNVKINSVDDSVFIIPEEKVKLLDDYLEGL